MSLLSDFLLWYSFILISLGHTKAAANFSTTPPYLAQRYAETTRSRGLFLDRPSDILIASRFGHISALWEATLLNGTVVVTQSLIVEATELRNHRPPKLPLRLLYDDRV